MINLLEEEYNATSGKYILHLTMGAGDTASDLPSAEKPFNSSNYSCFFDYGEPAENSTAVNEASGKVYLYNNGEWAEPEPMVETKVSVIVTGNPALVVEAVMVGATIREFTTLTGYYGVALCDAGETIVIEEGYEVSGLCYFADGTNAVISSTTGEYTIPENAATIVLEAST